MCSTRRRGGGLRSAAGRRSARRAPLRTCASSARRRVNGRKPSRTCSTTPPINPIASRTSVTIKGVKASRKGPASACSGALAAMVTTAEPTCTRCTRTRSGSSDGPAPSTVTGFGLSSETLRARAKSWDSSEVERNAGWGVSTSQYQPESGRSNGGPSTIRSRRKDRLHRRAERPLR